MDRTVEIRLLGPVRVVREGVELPLPRSRKVRALLALLALAPAPTSRSRLCDLLWDVPNDPRGELRWCLSKLRALLDDDDHPRVVTAGQSLVALDLSGCTVDARELERVASGGLADASTEELDAVAQLVAGDLLEGTQLDGAEIMAWLTAHRQRYRSLLVDVLTELALRAPEGSGDRLRRIEAWVQRAPFDRTAHEAMLDTLARAGRVREGEAHLEATIRAFEQEGLEWSELRERWLASRRQPPGAARVIVAEEAPPPETRRPRHGSILVMPFTDASRAPGQIADALTDEVITRLAKLRVLFVIARGTAYALRERGIGAHEAGRLANVAYVVSGTVRRRGQRLSVLVELATTEDDAIVWTDEVECVASETLSMVESTVDRIVAALSDEIERAECKRAFVKPPSSLDAWEAYHRGLWHMYRFTGPDNEAAAAFFRQALALDPLFARAHAGLSFTHFQNVFLDLTRDRDAQMALALESAQTSLAADERDPAAHWAMGRALWLQGDAGAIAELECSVELSPNFALGHYTLGFVHAQSGDPQAAIEAASLSRQLSPFDPLQFGMLGSIALANMRLGRRDEAVDWAVRAASRPNAHFHILAIAATNLALANRRDEARNVVARIRAKLPRYCVEDYLRAFRFTADAAALVRQGARRIGFD